jgi:insulysin
MGVSRIQASILFSIFSLLSPLHAAIPNKALSVVVEDKNPLRVLTPSLKGVKTRKLILNNNVKVILKSDSQARGSSAALAVNAGSWHDDPRYPGIAHFCEHMLFMGSKKYPDENGFWQYVQDNGGTINAYTATDRTVYMFSIDNDKLETSVDMFARFFIDPLFSENAISRELLAVNQEHQKNIEHDGWRSWFIFKQEGNQNHANRKFSTGTEDTLKVIGRENLEKWYKKHYKSSGMHLVVYSNKDLDTLQTMIEKSFSEIENAKDAIPSIAYAKITSPGQEGHITYIEPVKDIKELSISWEIPPAYANDMDKKTYSLISYAISHHMKGGLYAHLKEEGLIEELSSDCDRIGKDHLILTVSMNLTAEGMQKRDHILYTFFSALNKLKKGNIPAHIYNDMEAVLSTSYRWQSRKDPFAMTRSIAHNMVDEDLETFPYKTSMINDFDQKSSRDLLGFLSPYNALISVTGNSEDTHRTANKKEQWLGAKYSVSKINDDVLTAWETAPPHSDIILPNPNPYISKHQKLLREEVKESIDSPQLIASDDTGICYFWQDTHYLIPKTQIKMRIKSPEINTDKKSLCLNDLYSSFLEHHMASLISEGGFAGIYTNIYSGELGLNISVDGYHDKIGSYMMSFLSGLTTSYPTKEAFLLVKEEMLSSCTSATKNLPYVQGMALLKSLTSNAYLDTAVKRKTIEAITYEDFQSFHKNVLEENFTQVFISGNIDKENALLHFSEIKNTMSSKGSIAHTSNIAEYTPFYTENPTPKKVLLETNMGGNSAILAIDQGPFTFDSYASDAVLSTVLKEAFFTELRSKQQTGYIAGSFTSVVQGQMLQYFLVQSTTHYPEELLARYELFLEDFSKTMEKNVSKERFDMVKKSLITKLKTPTENLSTYSAINFEYAFTYNGDFDRNKKKIAALEKLDYQTFIKNSKLYISRENKKRLAILVEGNKVDSKSFGYTETSAKELSNLRR